MDVQAFSSSVTVPINDTLLEGLLHETLFLGELGGSNATDEWQVQLSSGQDVTILLEGEGALAANVRLLAPDGSQVASGTAAAGGQAAIQHTTTATGAYRVVVSGTGGTSGQYRGRLLVRRLCRT